MPRWLSSILIIAAFLALFVLAFIPRNLEVNVTTNVDDRDYEVNRAPSLHEPPETPDE